MARKPAAPRHPLPPWFGGQVPVRSTAGKILAVAFALGIVVFIAVAIFKVGFKNCYLGVGSIGGSVASISCFEQPRPPGPTEIYVPPPLGLR